MNFISLVPTYYPNRIQAPSLAYAQPQIKFPQSFSLNYTIINTISQALKVSLVKYENSLFSQIQAKTDEKAPETEVVPIKKVQKILQTEKEETKQRTINIQKQGKEKIQQQKITLKEKSQKSNRDSIQHITNEELLSENEENEVTKKTREHHHRIKKDKYKHKRRHFYLKVQDLDLIETINTPKMQITRTFLNERKESLLSRQVTCWNDKFKNRRDKREIRMLTN